MKKILYAIVFAVSTTFFLTGCAGSQETNITGLWKITDYKTDLKIDETMKDEYEKIIEETKEKSSFEFFADKTFSQTVQGVTKKGTWEILGEDLQLKQIFDGNKILLSKIQSVSDSELVIAQKDEHSGSTVVLTLKKQ